MIYVKHPPASPRGRRLQSAHPDNCTKLDSAQGHHRQTRLPHQLNLFQARLVFDLTKRNWSAEWTNRCKIDSAPIFFSCRRRIGVSRSRDLRQTDNSLFIPTVIEENFVTFAHTAQIIARRVISNTGPLRRAVCDKIRPRVGGRLLFHQPKILHDRVVNRFSRIRQLRRFVSQSI